MIARLRLPSPALRLHPGLVRPAQAEAETDLLIGGDDVLRRLLIGLHRSPPLPGIGPIRTGIGIRLWRGSIPGISPGLFYAKQAPVRRRLQAEAPALQLLEPSGTGVVARLAAPDR